MAKTMYDAIPHGTRGGWTNHGCRCDECREVEYAYHREWSAKNRGKYKERIREHDLMRYFGITIEEYNELYSKQDGKCAICGENPERWLDVDHDHETNKIRGLLCNPCNRGIGNLGDNIKRLEAAIEYLRSHSYE